MMNKFFIGGLFLLGLLLSLSATYLKQQSWEYTEQMRITGSIFRLVAIVLLIWKVFKPSNK